ncbi:calcipressin-2-like [Ylistrum balloti]|uniref:calcipressin-2-like n=1 Tax=Ylistrum balloti TaxID=509963 RepID=UPI002905C693|nr:calcipressin-2-like [Ylistrum balloti]
MRRDPSYFDASESNDCKMAENGHEDVDSVDENLDMDDSDVGNPNDTDFYDDLPDSVIVTNIGDNVFLDPDIQKQFEEVFRYFDEAVTFNFLKSFRRVRVNFSHPEFAVKAKLGLHEMEVCGSCIKCYMAQPRDKSRDKIDPHLQPPAPTKQFLISPPASPPVGWEPITESEPIINYDLLAAMANLAPGEAHELHPQTDSQPAIIVHICDNEEPVDLYGNKRPKLPQTRCPERKT